MKPLLLALALMAVLAWGGSSIAMPGSATFVDQAQVMGNALSTDTLSVPTGLSATGGASVALSWTATSDTYASGHRVFRASTSGGPYSQVAQVTPRTNTSYVDSPGDGTFYYVVRAYFQNWESVNSSQDSATVSTSSNTGWRACTSQMAINQQSGDQNGYQWNPGNLCANDSQYGGDIDSGTNTSTSCDDTGKDRHLFQNFNISIPVGATIQGIEVRLDGLTDSTSGTPRFCVHLSGDAFASWTTAKATSGLGTSEASFFLGGTSDLWGDTWTAGSFSNGNFYLIVTNVASNTSRDFGLDHVAVRVTYTP